MWRSRRTRHAHHTLTSTNRIRNVTRALTIWRVFNETEWNVNKVWYQVAAAAGCYLFWILMMLSYLSVRIVGFFFDYFNIELIVHIRAVQMECFSIWSKRIYCWRNRLMEQNQNLSPFDSVCICALRNVLIDVLFQSLIKWWGHFWDRLIAVGVWHSASATETSRNIFFA